MAQRYKAVYFTDLPANSSREKSLTLAFGNKAADLYENVKDLSSDEIRRLLGSDSYHKIAAEAGAHELPINTYCLHQLRRSLREMTETYHQIPLMKWAAPVRLFDPLTVTFKGGAKAPFVGWYPYLQGYSPQFVSQILEQYAPNANSVLDPFAGTGTTPFTIAQMGRFAYFCELNPVLQFITMSKIRVRLLKEHQRSRLAAAMIEASNSLSQLKTFPRDHALELSHGRVFDKSQFFDVPVFDSVLRLRSWIDELALSDPMLAEIVTVAVLSALVPASNMKRAGDLRYKTNEESARETVPLLETVSQNLARMASDVRADTTGLITVPLLVCENARNLSVVPNLGIEAVITSPPYVNGTNYFRNSKIELWFLRSLITRDDLARYRHSALTAGINDVTVGKAPSHCHPEVGKIVALLESHAYDSRIPRMIACYFSEIAEIFDAVSTHLVPGATVAVDMGDSCYHGIHVPSDHLLTACLQDMDFVLADRVPLRQRRSRGGMLLTQSLLVFKYRPPSPMFRVTEMMLPWRNDWNTFKATLPHQRPPFAQRNWGHTRHSLCSYPGKMKPAIAHHLVRTFVPEGGRILDPFAGVGTIPLEAALQGKQAYGFEISPAALIIASAKVGRVTASKCATIIESLAAFIGEHVPAENELAEAHTFGFNGRIADFYEPRTLGEIILARRFFRTYIPTTPEEQFVQASLLHILHGNRPYALSRRSHPITPYKPTGPFIYHSLVHHLEAKVKRSLADDLPPQFVAGTMYQQDATAWWPREIDDLDAVITSPPFYDSTRYYLANWIRLWFAGWSPPDFETRPHGFIDERQKASFEVYVPIIRQARERLKRDGALILHLGRSKKCDMAFHLAAVGKRWFRSSDLLDESVVHCESHGIRDKGTVTSHQYLILY